MIDIFKKGIIRLFLFAFIIIMHYSCENNSTEATGVNRSAGSKEGLSWLNGSWERVNEKEGRSTYEYWGRLNDTAYLGFGCTIENYDTIWYEHIRLSKTIDVWNLEVLGKEDSIPTVFIVTSLLEDGFICENDQNEFPKKIEYKREGDQLKAIISGGGTEIPFDFRLITAADNH